MLQDKDTAQDGYRDNDALGDEQPTYKEMPSEVFLVLILPSLNLEMGQNK
jgi:hypothetical protein